MTRDVLHDFEKAHDSELTVSVNQLDALLCQPRAAHRSETELGSQALERCRDARGVEIAGRLAGYEQNLTHDGARVRPVKGESARSPSRYGAPHPAPVVPPLP